MTIKQVQCLLLYLGYAPGDIDGIDGTGTRAAVREFQTDFGGIGVDGIAGEETQKALRHAVAYGFLKRETTEDSSEGAEDGNVPTKTGTYWDEIKYFTPDEPYIRCPCGKCAGELPEEKLMRLADRVREQAGVPMIPTSTVRCAAHNAAVGGVSTSRHLYRRAMDFYILGWNAQKTLALVKRQPEVAYAYAIDDSAVHMDVL